MTKNEELILFIIKMRMEAMAEAKNRSTDEINRREFDYAMHELAFVGEIISGLILGGEDKHA